LETYGILGLVFSTTFNKPLKSSVCQIIVIFIIFLHIYYNEINLIIGIAYRCVYRSTDKKNVDAKRVIGSHKSKKGRQCNGQTKKNKLINSGLQNNYTENWRLSYIFLICWPIHAPICYPNYQVYFIVIYM
jgi:hypothetical protein